MLSHAFLHNCQVTTAATALSIAPPRFNPIRLPYSISVQICKPSLSSLLQTIPIHTPEPGPHEQVSNPSSCRVGETGDQHQKPGPHTYLHPLPPYRHPPPRDRSSPAPKSSNVFLSPFPTGLNPLQPGGWVGECQPASPRLPQVPTYLGQPKPQTD